MTAVNTERLLSTFLELVQIDSPSGEEGQVAAYCRERLEGAGCRVHLDDTGKITGSDTGNLFAQLPSFDQGQLGEQLGLPLYFSAHMDTVDPCRGVKPHIKEGSIYSDGTTVLGSDDKVGIAAIIEMIRCLKEDEQAGKPHPEIRILLSVKEERGLLGAKAMDPTEFADAQGAFCYVLDAAGSPGLVVNGAPYQQSYKARFTGLAAHAGVAPEKGISAIHAAARAIAALPQGRIDEQTTTNVGTITGGSADNVVAAECTITGELRSHDEGKLLALRQKIEDILTAAQQESGTNPAVLDIAWEVNYAGFYAPEDSLEVACALAAAERLGFKAETQISGGGADTNILSGYGLAAVSLGCGMDRIHSTEERLSLEDLENLARLVLEIARRGYKWKAVENPPYA